MQKTLNLLFDLSSNLARGGENPLYSSKNTMNGKRASIGKILVVDYCAFLGNTAVMKIGKASQYRAGQETTIAIHQGKSLILDLLV